MHTVDQKLDNLDFAMTLAETTDNIDINGACGELFHAIANDIETSTLTNDQQARYDALVDRCGNMAMNVLMALAVTE